MGNPRLRESLMVVPDESGEFFYIYDEDNGRIKVVNQTGKRILDLCDGSRDIAEIVAALTNEFEGPPDRIESDVRGFISQMITEGLVVE
ncbi:MAG: PqqD family peptide modification chaperone [Firmicutes bacterium]|nr:PqqD family peptide modification chaperone [Candidatus Fermentithermobacillaceae bacterium]